MKDSTTSYPSIEHAVPRQTVHLKARLVYHRFEGRVRAHVLFCMLAYYVEWQMRRVESRVPPACGAVERAGQQRALACRHQQHQQP